MSGPVDVLAAWANDTTCSLAEANQRATVYAAVAELIELSRVIDAEFRSDPMAVQCFDLGVLRRWQSALNNVGGMQ
jgi:hypothetical protein